MGLYDEQIKEREQFDDLEFEKACLKMTDAILGKKAAMQLETNDLQIDNAITAVLGYYHIKESSNTDRDNTLEEKLEHALNPHGILRRRVNLTDGWYKDAYGPYITTMKESGRIVALLPAHPFGYRFYDVDSDKYVKVNSKNSKLFDEEAYGFYRPFPMRELKIADLILYMKSLITVEDLMAVLMLYLFTTLLGMLTPKFTGLLYGTVVNVKSVQLLVAAGVFMIMSSISRIITGALKGFFISRINTKVEVSVQAATMMRILSLPPGFFRHYTSGELSSISGYISNLCDLLISTLLSTSLSSLFSLMYIFQIFNYAPSLVVPAITVVIISTAFNLLTTLANIKRQKKIMAYASKSSGIGYSLLTGVEKIKLTGSEKRAFAKWADNYAKEAELEYNPHILLKESGVISAAITTFGTIIIYFLTAKNGVSLSEYTAFMAAYGLMTGAFSEFTAIAAQIANIKPTIDMCKPILEACPEISDNKEVLKGVKGNITIDNVAFRYDEKMPYIYKDFSLKVHSGEYVAIVGKTGCGKSTLVRLILGFEKPEMGAIYVDGKDINTVDIKSLRRHIGTVMQNGKVFQGDIFSNIVVSAPGATVDDAWEAAKIAGLDEDIKAMPMKMNTVISEGQGGISGGQRQRLMIARAVAGKPNLLIMDEATSALDNITQKKVTEALAKLNCTRIVIAHRLSTIKDCDRIIVLDCGRIVEEGTYSELIEKNGFFKKLVERQIAE